MTATDDGTAADEALALEAALRSCYLRIEAMEGWQGADVPDALGALRALAAGLAEELERLERQARARASGALGYSPARWTRPFPDEWESDEADELEPLPPREPHSITLLLAFRRRRFGRPLPRPPIPDPPVAARAMDDDRVLLFVLLAATLGLAWLLAMVAR